MKHNVQTGDATSSVAAVRRDTPAGLRCPECMEIAIIVRFRTQQRQGKMRVGLPTMGNVFSLDWTQCMHQLDISHSIAQMRGGLVVSCQAPPGSPLRRPEIMAAMARAAEMGGASAIRANGPADITAILDVVSLPVVGLNKVDYDDSPVYITPTIDDIDPLLAAGCRMIAIDATDRPRPGGVSLRELVEHIHSAGAIAFGDIATAGDIPDALDAGVDAIGSTLSGYTTAEAPPEDPDLELIQNMAAEVSIPIYAEGRYATPEHVASAMEAGASMVVIGAAITDPVALTRRFVAPLKERNDHA